MPLEKGQKSFVSKTPVSLMLSLPMMNFPAVFKKDVPLPVSSCLGGFFQKCFCQNQAQNLVLIDALSVHSCHFLSLSLSLSSSSSSSSSSSFIMFYGTILSQSEAMTDNR